MKNGPWDRKLWLFIVLKVLRRLYQLAFTLVQTSVDKIILLAKFPCFTPVYRLYYSKYYRRQFCATLNGVFLVNIHYLYSFMDKLQWKIAFFIFNPCLINLQSCLTPYFCILYCKSKLSRIAWKLSLIIFRIFAELSSFKFLFWMRVCLADI